ncbi:MAG: DUF4347 domain-containing protein [Steroidobacteraceae bacterium]
MKVWACYGIKSGFIDNAEWKVVGFSNIANLVPKLKDLDDHDLEELALVTHGNAPGVLQIDPELNSQNVDSYANDIEKLRDYLASGAQVTLYGCAAGCDAQGDILLKRLSGILAGCRIVGFFFFNELYGPVPGPKAVRVFSGNVTRSDEYSEAAKWARNGVIIRPPLIEVTKFQEHDPAFTNRCGSDKCPGHSKFGDWCSPYRRTRWPTWPVSRDEIDRLRKRGLSQQPSKHKSVHGTKTHGVRLDSPAHPSGAGGFKAPQSGVGRVPGSLKH